MHVVYDKTLYQNVLLLYYVTEKCNIGNSFCYDLSALTLATRRPVLFPKVLFSGILIEIIFYFSLPLFLAIALMSETD